MAKKPKLIGWYAYASRATGKELPTLHASSYKMPLCGTPTVNEQLSGPYLEKETDRPLCAHCRRGAYKLKWGLHQ